MNAYEFCHKGEFTWIASTSKTEAVRFFAKRVNEHEDMIEEPCRLSKSQLKKLYVTGNRQDYCLSDFLDTIEKTQVFAISENQ